MLILLKLLCFSVWLVIIFYMVQGSRHPFPDYKEVKLMISNEDDLEMHVYKAISRLKKNDRLIIEDASDHVQRQYNLSVFRRLRRKNPSLVYLGLSENWSF